ncbi:MAG: phosphate ABC transporter permease subunit PstC [Syntrophomonadaceae bacterium]|jgi:phosphate transport system permease protein|nr:phosphate ABC transporter permease subunit PstC [Syntrophomonadaceae bacterium]MDH7498182.1 phosphate ABC transporter permease subunit PstC [Syntrophomonadaceae bacterium]
MTTQGGGRPAQVRAAHERLVALLLLATSLVSVLAIALIIVFLFAKGMPLLGKVGVWHFLTSPTWNPTRGEFGIATMLVGSLVVTLGALAWGAPLGLALAIFLAELAPPRVTAGISWAVDLLAGIPSVVYGFFGLVVIVPFIRERLGGPGFSILAGVIILGIMILPTIVNISRDAIRAVPRDYKEGSLALGATHWQTIVRILVPSARSGILAGIVLGMGRAIGETMAVVLVTGNVTRMPDSILSPVRTMTSNVVLEMGYASGDHQLALFATGMVLFVFIVVMNVMVSSAMRTRG